MGGASPPDPLEEVRGIARHYAEESGETLARRFVEGFRAAVDHIHANPAAGSPRFREMTGLFDLRVWPVRGFPYLVFYRDTPEGVLILRILHCARDIPATLRDG